MINNNRIRAITLIPICFIVLFTNTIQAQTVQYFPDEYPSRIYYNPGAIAFHRNFSAFSTVLLQNSASRTPLISYMVGIDGMLSPLRSGVNICYRNDYSSRVEHQNSINIGYSFIAIQGRTELLGFGVNATYNSLEITNPIGFGRMDVFQTDTIQNLFPGMQYFWNFGAGSSFRNENWAAGLSVRNMFFLKPEGSGLRLSPVLFGSISKKITIRSLLFYPELLGSYKLGESVSNDYRFLRANEPDNISFSLKLDNKFWSAGLGLRLTEKQQPLYFISGGYHDRTVELSLSAGLMLVPTSLEKQQSVFLSQFTFSYALAKSREGHRYKLRQVSAWRGFLGGAGSSATSTSSYTNVSFYNNSGVVNRRFDEGVKGGVLTAGEVNDFSKWELWTDISKDQLAQYQKAWGIFPDNRFSVILTNASGGPAIDVPIFLCSEAGDTIWASRTDNLGRAELWTGMFGKSAQPHHLCININGDFIISQDIKPFSEGVNIISVPTECKRPMVIDLCFAVDATSSMSDEISYLQRELINIINSLYSTQSELQIRTSSLFYRCYGNSFVTNYSDFSNDFSTTGAYINGQSSGEGGTEAVEVALYDASRKLSWSSEANTRLLFIVLDEPPAYSASVIDSMHNVTAELSQKGIHVIPMIASGAAKDLEYLMRSIALATGGTSVFLSDHSGIGDSHLQPVTDKMNIEYFNKLILRLISQYSYVPACDQTYEDALKEAKDTTNVEIVLSIDTVMLIQDYYTPVSDSVIAINAAISAVADTIYKIVPVDVINFRFYPNPTSGPVFVESSSKLIEAIYLFDANGRILQRFEMKQEEIVEIGLSQYPDGIYYLKCFVNEQWYGEKIILIH